jgi:hypothetical protein
MKMINKKPILLKAADVIKLRSYRFKGFRRATSAAFKKFPKDASTSLKSLFIFSQVLSSIYGNPILWLLEAL